MRLDSPGLARAHLGWALFHQARYVDATKELRREVIAHFSDQYDAKTVAKTFGAIEKERMQSTPFPCALVAVRIEECRDHGAAGVKFVGPSYSFHDGKEHRSEVEKAVFAELKGPPPTI